ncbi:MAG: peptidoglycan-binding protein, partial [Hyphomicrobiales bacterium]|nr:peptidoglycan-binding protein [Hyphomicrobiales bacterium]
AIDGIFGPLTDAAVRALQGWAGVPATGVVDDTTWFVWLTPGTAQQLTLERACGFLNNL